MRAPGRFLRYAQGLVRSSFQPPAELLRPNRPPKPDKGLMDTVKTYAEAVSQHGRSFVRRMVSQERWQRPAPNVYVSHNGPLCQAERVEVALSACGTGAVLGGLTALAIDRFKGIEDSRPTVVMPIGSKPPPYDDVTTHWSKWLDDKDVHPLREPQRTRPERSLVDAASWAVSDAQARLITIAGIQQGMATTRMLRESLTRRGRCKRRSIIVESILDAAGGIQSLPERDFREICRTLRLPTPSQQRPMRGKDGRYYLDVEWTEFHVSVEIHGMPHMAVRQWDADLERANEIVIGDKRLLIFSSFGVRHRSDRVGDQMVRMLVAAGWTQEST